MLKELPGQLNRKLKRMQDSRDSLKENNREKAEQNKKLRDRNVEIIESREMWKSRCKELEQSIERQKEELRLQTEAFTKAIKAEKLRGDNEQERALLLQQELEYIKKKART